MRIFGKFNILQMTFYWSLSLQWFKARPRHGAHDHYQFEIVAVYGGKDIGAVSHVSDFWSWSRGNARNAQPRYGPYPGPYLPHLPILHTSTLLKSDLYITPSHKLDQFVWTRSNCYVPANSILDATHNTLLCQKYRNTSFIKNPERMVKEVWHIGYPISTTSADYSLMHIYLQKTNRQTTNYITTICL